MPNDTRKRFVGMIQNETPCHDVLEESMETIKGLNVDDVDEKSPFGSKTMEQCFYFVVDFFGCTTDPQARLKL